MNKRIHPILPRSFYARQTELVARELLGKLVVHGETSGMIVETEAYLGENDLAAHSAVGITPRTKVIFGAPGHAYIYLNYGIHECLNMVAEADGTAGAVLIRALEPVDGIEIMRERRGGKKDLASGPGKLTQAMGIGRALNGADLTKGPLTVHEYQTPAVIECSPRIGISKAVDMLLRFVPVMNPIKK